MVIDKRCFTSLCIIYGRVFNVLNYQEPAEADEQIFGFFFAQSTSRSFSPQTNDVDRVLKSHYFAFERKVSDLLSLD